MEELAVAACVRLQPQNTEDESSGTTQTCTAKSYERRRAGVVVVNVGKFYSQFPLPQTAGRDEPQCRGTIRNVFEVRTKAFSESTSHVLRNNQFSLKSMYHTIANVCVLKTADAIPKALRHALRHP